MSNVETIDPSMFSDSLFRNNSINNNSNRRDNYENRRDDSSSSSSSSSSMDNKDQSNQSTNKNDDEPSNDTNHNPINIAIAIFRYKFTQEFMVQLYQFSKIHQYDDRKSFKEAWQQWVIDNEELVGSEVTRLADLGYKGDIIDKMFKSSRYYFRKKSTKKTELSQTQQKQQNHRKHYVCIKKEMLDEMDSHIAGNIRTDNYKPSDGFLDFCNSNVELLKTGISNLIEQGMKDPETIREKIKKTYKNRYFIYRQTAQSKVSAEL
jgi:hypothetical protein